MVSLSFISCARGWKMQTKSWYLCEFHTSLGSMHLIHVQIGRWIFMASLGIYDFNTPGSIIYSLAGRESLPLIK